jgi:hypothetical protein
VTDPAEPDPAEPDPAEPDPPLTPAERRRLIQRAIREGAERPPEGLERLAQQVALRQAALRWITVLYAVGFVVEVVSLFVEKGAGTQARDAVLALLFLAVGAQQYRVGVRARQAADRWEHPRNETTDPGPLG